MKNKQFTGLCDENGEKIFEGDIVEITDNFPFDENYPPKHKVVAAKNKDNSIIENHFTLINAHGKICIWNWTKLKKIS